MNAGAFYICAMRNKDTYSFDRRRLEQLEEFFSASGEKPLRVKTSPSGEITISCVSGCDAEKGPKVKTSHSGGGATSGSSPPRKRRGAPPGNQRALKTGYHTAKKRKLRSRVARLIAKVNLSLALVGKTDRVKRRRLPRATLNCYPPTKQRLTAEKARAAERGPRLEADPAIFSPCALDSPAAAERPAEGIVDG